MKVALVGNMNNNFFSMMRYFRDQGVDAHLLMFADETTHFLPENDTWYPEKWRPYIRTMELINTEWGLISKPISVIREQLAGYDRYIGCGIIPGYFYKAQLPLQIFVPYAYGVEYYGYHKVNVKRPVRELTFQIARYYQKNGIQKNTAHVVTADKTDYNVKMLNKLNVTPDWLPIPMVYNKESADQNTIPQSIKEIAESFKCHNFVLFSHVSHKWKKIPRDWNNISIKSNDVLIRGFAEFVRTNTIPNPLLALVEYGYDVPNSKKLISELGIQNHVRWLPLMSRKEIMYLLDYVDLGGAELGGVMWGGTGWEFLSKGVPFFQYVNLNASQFREMTATPMPPFLNVQNESQICRILFDFTKDKEKYLKIGRELKEWFERYNGITLARQFIELLDLNENKQ